MTRRHLVPGSGLVAAAGALLLAAGCGSAPPGATAAYVALYEGADRMERLVDSPRRTGHSRDGTVIEGEAWLVPAAENEGRFDQGARVFHQKFGYGKVVNSNGNKLEVAFEKAGTKKVIDSFVEPA